MNITNLAKKWLIEHEHHEHDPLFSDDLLSLVRLLEEVRDYPGYVGDAPEYDPNFGDQKLCQCGHPYYRHFDTYDGMAPVGCKYCYHWQGYGNRSCAGFKEQKEHKADCGCKSCMGTWEW
jgi:hypothetical protein